MDTNQEIDAAASRLDRTFPQVAEILRGIVANNPDLPRQHSEDDEADNIWWDATGAPDLAYGPALKMARQINDAHRQLEGLFDTLVTGAMDLRKKLD